MLIARHCARHPEQFITLALRFQGDLSHCDIRLVLIALASGCLVSQRALKLESRGV